MDWMDWDHFLAEVSDSEVYPPYLMGTGDHLNIGTTVLGEHFQAIFAFSLKINNVKDTVTPLLSQLHTESSFCIQTMYLKYFSTYSTRINTYYNEYFERVNRYHNI
jgi:hypothetical protein